MEVMKFIIGFFSLVGLTESGSSLEEFEFCAFLVEVIALVRQQK